MLGLLLESPIKQDYT